MQQIIASWVEAIRIPAAINSNSISPYSPSYCAKNIPSK